MRYVHRLETLLTSDAVLLIAAYGLLWKALDWLPDSDRALVGLALSVGSILVYLGWVTVAAVCQWIPVVWSKLSGGSIKIMSFLSHAIHFGFRLLFQLFQIVFVRSTMGVFESGRVVVKGLSRFSFWLEQFSPSRREQSLIRRLNLENQSLRLEITNLKNDVEGLVSLWQRTTGPAEFLTRPGGELLDLPLGIDHAMVDIIGPKKPKTKKPNPIGEAETSSQSISVNAT